MGNKFYSGLTISPANRKQQMFLNQFQSQTLQVQTVTWNMLKMEKMFP